LLLECTEIKDLWPLYNKALKRFEPKYGLFEYEARNGYRYLAIGKLTKSQSCIETFDTIYDGINLLQELAKKFEIDQRFCKYGSVSDGETPLQTNSENFPDSDNHNDQIQVAIDFYLNSRPSFAIIDKGRTNDERSYIWVENGRFYGMGYIDFETTINDLSQIKEHIIPYKSNQYITQLIFSFAQKYPRKVHLHKNNLDL
jgi:DNA polymerase-3 subunit epsilon